MLKCGVVIDVVIVFLVIVVFVVVVTFIVVSVGVDFELKVVVMLVFAVDFVSVVVVFVILIAFRNEFFVEDSIVVFGCDDRASKGEPFWRNTNNIVHIAAATRKHTKNKPLATMRELFFFLLIVD